MSKLTVEDTSLVAVADAIRTKSGTTDALAFPDGFVDAIDNMQGENHLAKMVDDTITEVTAEMLDGCTKIRKCAFYYCHSITNIVIPEEVTTIEDNAFGNCTSLASVVLPSTLKTIKESAFAYCSSLTNIVIPERVVSIGNDAFNGCSILTNVEVKPTAPPSLGTNVFKKCSALTQIIVPVGKLATYQSATNWSAYADIMVEATE